MNEVVMSGGSPRSCASEHVDRTIRHQNHLWLLAIVLMVGLALAVDALDLFLWMETGDGLHVSPVRGSSHLARGLLLCCMCLGALYFYRIARRLMSDNRILVSNLESHARLLADKNDQIERLKQLSDNLIRQVDLKPALDLALEMATDVIGARTASIMLLDQSCEFMTIAAARGVRQEIIDSARVKVGEGLSGVVAKAGEAIVINSDHLDARLAPHAHRTQEVKSAIIAPIKIDGDVRGVINVSNKRDEQQWGDEDLAVVSTLASQAAMVLQKIELYDNLQEQVAMLRDALQELKKTQASLIQSEKLSSIGQIAGGVAHEINSPLLVILGRAEFALERLKPDDPIAKDLEIVRSQTERIAEIVRSLLNFSRSNKTDDFRPVRVNELIKSSLMLVGLQMSKQDIKAISNLEEDIPEVWANPGQVQQVFLNLAINAYQAMSKQGGTLSVSSKCSDGVVSVAFQDTGPGIAADHLPMIFEPYFTTKVEGEGTGLGLAIGQGIIRAHGGDIIVESEPGQGATFTVELPVAGAAQQKGGV